MIYSKDQLELSSTVGQGEFHVIFFKCEPHVSCIFSGESGLVYKGYINTSIGKELVAIKTGKGMNGAFYKLYVIPLMQLYFPSLISRDWQMRFVLCFVLIIQMLCL